MRVVTCATAKAAVLAGLLAWKVYGAERLFIDLLGWAGSTSIPALAVMAVTLLAIMGMTTINFYHLLHSVKTMRRRPRRLRRTIKIEIEIEDLFE